MMKDDDGYIFGRLRGDVFFRYNSKVFSQVLLKPKILL